MQAINQNGIVWCPECSCVAEFRGQMDGLAKVLRCPKCARRYNANTLLEITAGSTDDGYDAARADHRDPPTSFSVRGLRHEDVTSAKHRGQA